SGPGEEPYWKRKNWQKSPGKTRAEKPVMATDQRLPNTPKGNPPSVSKTLMELSKMKAHWKSCLTDMEFYAPWLSTTCLHQIMIREPLHNDDGVGGRWETLSKVRSGRPKEGKNILPA